MISGIFVRHYGIYKNINYIPLSDGDKFTSIIGDNGVGKSSILDALDKFMNPKDAGDWIINKQARLEGGIKTSDKAPYIAPCFLIAHKDAAHFSPENLKTLKIISNYFWTTSKKSQLEDFFNHRELLIQNQAHHTNYLLIIGRQHEEKDPFFFSFETELKAALTAKSTPKPDFTRATSNLLAQVLESYTYLYIPVETNVGSFTKLETNNMQILMDKNIQDAVGKTITEKTVTDINSKLDKFITDIEKILPSYTYKAPGKKNKLTKLDIIQKTIESYFSIKVLHKKINKSDISVENLSSGEKRRALVDLAYSFLMSGEKRDKIIVLAIDEPESSLHIDGCFEQFERLKNIAEKGHQTIITTHWYGHLPIASSGKSILIKKEDNEIQKHSFNIANYREQLNQEKDKTKGRLPYNVQLKSYNDLTQSIIASIQNGYNWIICEGSSEKIYLEAYLKRSTLNKYRVLPAGGAPEVLKIAKFLQTPLQDKDLSPSGKIFCLIDTDRDSKEFNKDNAIKCLDVKRILREKDTIQLVEIESTNKSPVTEIEDALDSILFLKTLRDLATPEINKIIQEESVRADAKTSGYCLNLRDSERELLNEFFSQPGMKYQFAKKYTLEQLQSPPSWIVDIVKIFGGEFKNSIETEKTNTTKDGNTTEQVKKPSKPKRTQKPTPTTRKKPSTPPKPKIENKAV
ncbi:MAG: AAA family ATPase [Pseudomonas sp.]|uniref:AAA family ATPase n=1 Tax=Pseudomonas sp. TaxID=306 RepID=UPI002715A054|nr:AAA family ATPase [Pseudomonas sp.]MDO9617928.1 AAA family ATPase [Pseudomonas sp.]MDP2444958.1 AAA family ATPase [Pseudomonas sp.]MDZ4316919.1 AAA family ATPase [Azonexus sp.]